MLTLDLLRVRVKDDEIRPWYLTLTGGRRYVDIAQRLTEIFRAHIGRTAGELDEAVEEFIGSAQDFKTQRGLARILNEFTVFRKPSEVDAEELRMVLFSELAADRPLARKPDLVYTRTVDQALADVAPQIGLSVEEIDKALYADIAENQLIDSVEPTLDALRLIHRYNTALAQALLYRALGMVIEVFDSYRPVFKYIKLARLMHEIKTIPGGYRIYLDGPMSLFSNTERYGIGMAKLLPALLKAKKWRMEAVVNTSHWNRKIFRLDNTCGLQSHYKDEPVFDSTAEEAFFEKFARNKKSKWTVEREGSILDLGDTVMIPDFVFRHPDGREVHLEIVGFWTPEYLEKKLEKARRAGLKNLILAAPESLNCAVDSYEGPVLRYKTRLLLKDVLPMLEFCDE